MIDQSKIALAASWIRSADNIVAFTGAGISTPSGIPDFRSENSGFWEQADPFVVASLAQFRKNPETFYKWVRPLVELKYTAKPNPAHDALVDLERMDKLTAVITQNTDSLHTLAGNRCVHELHGHMRTSTCVYCFREYDSDPILRQYLDDGDVPRCDFCGGTIKPNVILFGEQLPYKPLNEAKKAARNTDLMLVVGTSLEVEPASTIPMIAQRNGARVVIVNKDKTLLSAVDLTLYGDAAEILPAIVQCTIKATETTETTTETTETT